MVGIVVVSHSRALARAAVALAREMVPSGPQARGQLRITVAAGLDDTTLGTDAGQIVEAITAADQGAGVVVLMDLGSAVLSAELALDLLDDETRGQVVLCPAPLVEGLVVAAVTAAGGATRQEVAAEAAGALAGKTSHLWGSPTPAGATPVAAGDGPDRSAHPDDTGADELMGTFTVANPHGLHARPASRLVQQAHTFDARVRLRNLTTGSAWVPASSLSKVATLGALRGHQVEVRVTGNRAQEALDQVLALAARSFGEPAPATVASAALSTSAGQDHSAPLSASPGVGIGPARQARCLPVDPVDTSRDDPTAQGGQSHGSQRGGQTQGDRSQWRDLQEALTAVRGEVHRARTRAAREMGEPEAAIFDAHLLLLDDSDLLGRVRSRLDRGEDAAPAWSAAISQVSAELAAIPDPYLRARAADVRAVGDQVLRALLGIPPAHAQTTGVLVARDLTPAEAAALDRSRIVAVLLAFGSPLAHSTILLRASGIPAVVAAGPAVLDIPDGTLLAVDGTRGEFVVDPPADVRAAWRGRAADLHRRERAALAHAAAPARTRDGVVLHVGANVGSAQDARAAASCGADLAGLVRTEFLFLGRADAPTAEEQEAAYRDVAAALCGKRITLRTLDVGGDKPLGYLPAAAEGNPFLGVRGIRLSLAHPALLADQLLAIVRVAHDVPVSVLFPMISTLDELVRARRLLDNAISLAGRGQPPGLQVGIMVEVPATALKAAAFAGHVDFLSIGTNDLSQYALAAERGNPALGGLGDPLDPGVLRLVDAACRGAGPQTPVAVCGELAADERATALLLGLGVRELSVAPRAVPAIKQAVRGLDARAASALAAAAIAAPSAAAVRELLARFGR